MAARWWRILARPHVILAVFLFTIALFMFVRTLGERGPTHVVVQMSAETDDAVPSTIQLTLQVPGGEAYQKPVSAVVPEQQSERLQAVLELLREELLQLDVWPEAVPAPLVFIETIDRQPTAVLSFSVPTGLAISLAAELVLYNAIEKTALANGAARLVVLQDGEPTGVFLTHVAVRTTP